MDEQPIGPTPLRVLDFTGDPGDESDYDGAVPQFNVETEDLLEAAAEELGISLEDGVAVEDGNVFDLVDGESAGEEEPEVSLADILEMLYQGIAELVEAANDLDARVKVLEKRPQFASSLKNVRP